MKQILFIACLFLTIAIQAQEASTIVQAMNNYDYETAIKLIEQEVPTTDLLFQKAKAHKGLLQYNEAILCLQDILKEHPENMQALIESAENYRFAGKLTESLKLYEKIISLQPNNKFLKLQYLSLLNRLEKHNQVIEVCYAMMESDSSAYVLRMAAQAYDALLDDKNAISYYKKALEKNPQDYVSVSRLATLHIEVEPEYSIKLTEEYRKLDNSNIFVNRVNAQAYCMIQDYKTANERYQYLIDQGDISKTTCYYYGMSNFILENYKKAYKYLTTALFYDPTNINIYYYLGRAASRIQKVKEGIDYLNIAVTLSIPKDEEMGKLYVALAESYGRDNDRNNQIAALKEQLKYQPQNQLILYRLATVYHDFLEDEKNAEKYYEMFLKTMPEDMELGKIQVVGGVEMRIIKKGELEDYYLRAQSRLKDIKVEKFFRDGVKEEETKK